MVQATIPSYAPVPRVPDGYRTPTDLPHVQNHDALSAAIDLVANAIALHTGNTDLSTVPAGAGQVGLVRGANGLWTPQIIVGQPGPPGEDGADGITGPPGSGFNFRGDWLANTLYAANDTVRGPSGTAYFGGVYVAIAPFTSTATFNPANWNTLIPPFVSSTDLRLAGDVSCTDNTTWKDVFAVPIGAGQRQKAALLLNCQALGPGTTAAIMFRLIFAPSTGNGTCNVFGKSHELASGSASVAGGQTDVPISGVMDGSQTFGVAGLSTVAYNSGGTTAQDLTSIEFDPISIENGASDGTWKVQAKQITNNPTNPSLVKGNGASFGTVQRVA